MDALKLPMRESLTTIGQRLSGLIVLLIFLAGATRVYAMVDLNTNGMSDVWEMLYGATNVSPNIDSDGDGFNNMMESIAGTDPFNAASYPQISGVVLSGTNLVMSSPGVPGKLYQLQGTLSLNPPVWTTEATVFAVPGMTNVSFPEPPNLAGQFFRVSISDVDTNGGLNA